MDKWEYKVEEFDFSKSTFGLHKQVDALSKGLNRLGSQGWELVHFESLPNFSPGGGAKVVGYQYLALLKRKVD